MAWLDRTLCAPRLPVIAFLVSIAIYVWTVAWFLHYVRDARWATRIVSTGVAAAMLVEIVSIVMQSGRGVQSHFNDATGFDTSNFMVANCLAKAVDILGGKPLPK